MNSTIDHILNLKLGVTRYGPAPHKPVLLLAVAKAFEMDEVRGNRLRLSEELLLHFYDQWKSLVHTPHVPNISLPFYHLKNEKGKFWELVTYPGINVPATKSKSIKSFKALRETVMYARLSDELYAIMMNPVKREELKLAILKKYFGLDREPLAESSWSKSVMSQMLNEPEENYARRVRREIEEQHTDAREEFVMARSASFSKAVKHAYNNQCAVTGLRISYKQPLLDACHIIPFSESFNDSVRNGIALSPTFHRAFDHGYFTVTEDYRVLVNPAVMDSSPAHSLRQYDRKRLYLPASQRHYPAAEFLRQHRDSYG